MQIEKLGSLIGIVIGIGLGVLSNALFYLVLGEVNGRSPEAERISPWGVNTKLAEVFRRHRELYPDSKARLWVAFTMGLGAAIFFASVLATVEFR
jgi:hypothetical protein